MSEVLSSLALGACGREIVAGVELVSEQGTRLSLGGTCSAGRVSQRGLLPSAGDRGLQLSF